MLEIIGLTGIAVEGGENPSQPITLIAKLNNSGGFIRLEKITTNAATEASVMFDNIKDNYKRQLPFVHDLSEFKQLKGDEKIAIVGGGPSLKEHLDELREFKYIIAAGSVHDYLVDQGIIPTYAAACDPDPIMANYYRNANETTKYLIATCCDKVVFETLQGKNVYMWNCFSDGHSEQFAEIDPNFQAIGGGCTVGLRSISIAIMLGFNNLHFFGFDSSISSEDDHHAYKYIDEEREQECAGGVFNIKIGINTPGEKTYKCYGYHIGQVDQFKMFYQAYSHAFTPTFHGSGLLPDVWRMTLEDIEKQKVANNE